MKDIYRNVSITSSTKTWPILTKFGVCCRGQICHK